MPIGESSPRQAVVWAIPSKRRWSAISCAPAPRSAGEVRSHVTKASYSRRTSVYMEYVRVLTANFLELRLGEVRSKNLLGASVNSPLGYAPSLRAGKIKPTTHKRKEGPTDPHERTAIVLAEALRAHGKLFLLPSPAKGFRLHNRPHGEGRALSAGTQRRLRKAKQLSRGDRTDRELPRVHRDR